MVNSKSGSRQGQKYLDLGYNKVSFEVGGPKVDPNKTPTEGGVGMVNVTLHIIDIFNADQKLKSLKEIKLI